MTNIRGNHVALVEAGRAGSDVVVADSDTTNKNIRRGKKMNLIEKINKFLEMFGIKDDEAPPPDDVNL